MKLKTKDLIKASHDFLEALYSKKWTIPAPHSFRVSSLPYCPILDLYERRHETVLEESFSKTFYTTIGTATHENLMQTLMPLVEKHGQGVFGNWECNTCKTHYKFMTYKRACRKHKNCNSVLKYEEIAFTFEGLSGHVDMVWDHKGHFIAYEFKTTGSALFSQSEDYASRYFPDPKHRIQIKAYCTLLYLLYKIRVAVYNIVYINRDRPDNKNMKRIGKTNLTGNYNYRCYSYVYTKDIYKEFKERLKTASENRNRVEIALETNKKSLKENMIKEIIENKPCGSKLEYDNYMSAKFFGEKQCEFYKNGSCFKPKQIEKNIRDLLD